MLIAFLTILSFIGLLVYILVGVSLGTFIYAFLNSRHYGDTFYDWDEDVCGWVSGIFWPFLIFVPIVFGLFAGYSKFGGWLGNLLSRKVFSE